MTYRLTVTYKMDWDNLNHRDDEAENIAGRKPVASGCLMADGTRDLEFHFDSPDQARDVREEFLRSGFQAGDIRPLPASES